MKHDKEDGSGVTARGAHGPEYSAMDGYQLHTRCPACGAGSNLFARYEDDDGNECSEYQCGSCGEGWAD